MTKGWLFVGVQIVCSGVSIHVHRRPFEVQDGAGAGRAGGAIHRLGPGTALLSHPCYRVNFKDFYKSKFDKSKVAVKVWFCQGRMIEHINIHGTTYNFKYLDIWYVVSTVFLLWSYSV